MTEEEFLKNYNPNDFDLLSLTTDILLFSVSSKPEPNYRKLSKKYFSVLLVKRTTHPFKDKWCLPGGFINIDEDLEDCPKRILANETNLHDIYMEQLYTFGAVDRDPRMRIISTAYMALVDKNMLKDKLAPNASWFNVNVSEQGNHLSITLDDDYNHHINLEYQKVLENKTSGRYKIKVVQNDGLAFDHALVLATGIDRLKNKIEYTDIVFNMMPEYFTLGELQQVYETILGKKLLDPAFRRIIANKVVKTDKVRSGGGHRPSALFKYRDYDETNREN